MINRRPCENLGRRRWGPWGELGTTTHGSCIDLGKLSPRCGVHTQSFWTRAREEKGKRKGRRRLEVGRRCVALLCVRKRVCARVGEHEERFAVDLSTVGEGAREREKK
ncbi:unnamed protein product [Ixodes pacificus]